jgi:hypothetical protein
MSKINGVHALLAILVQQNQLSKKNGGVKVDLKHVEIFLRESQQLNERLRKIEALLTARPTTTKSIKVVELVEKPAVEGEWPAASIVRDAINKQERQLAFGHWKLDENVIRGSEHFSHREDEEQQHSNFLNAQQVLIQRYVPTDEDLELSNISSNFGMDKASNRDRQFYPDDYRIQSSNEESGRLLVIAVGLALLLFTLFQIF